MLQATHKFSLVSGIEAEVSCLTGKEQRILTEQKAQTIETRQYALLASILRRVGDVYLDSFDKDSEREEFLKSMLSCDRKQALVMARQFTNDFDPEYDFDFEYTSVDPAKGKQTFPQSVRLNEDGTFPFQPIKDFNADMLKGLTKLKDIKAVLAELKPKVFGSYEDVLNYKFIYFTLPVSGIAVRMRMLDGVGEAIGSGTKKEQRSSHTMLMMRNPCYKSGEAYISFSYSDLDKMHVNDLEMMRLIRKHVEGNVDSEIQFEHPEAELMPGQDKTVVIDLSMQTSFFFQSGTV